MKFELYKFKFYLNASHFIYIRGNRGATHPHTWEISIDTMKLIHDFIQFDKVENFIEKDMEKFQNRELNDLPEFKNINPTLETICDFFQKRIAQIFNEHAWFLLSIEMSETPTRSYVINLANQESLMQQYAKIQEHFKYIDQTVMRELEDVLNFE